MRHDLGLNDSNWKHFDKCYRLFIDAYDNHYGKGNWELEWIPTEQVFTHEGLNAAIKANQEKANATNG